MLDLCICLIVELNLINYVIFSLKCGFFCALKVVGGCKNVRFLLKYVDWRCMSLLYNVERAKDLVKFEILESLGVADKPVKLLSRDQEVKGSSYGKYIGNWMATHLLLDFMRYKNNLPVLCRVDFSDGHSTNILSQKVIFFVEENCYQEEMWLFEITTISWVTVWETNPPSTPSIQVFFISCC